MERILGDKNNLENYVKIAIAGNIIDFGALGLDMDMEELIIKTMEKDPTINNTNELENELKI